MSVCPHSSGTEKAKLYHLPHASSNLAVLESRDVGSGSYQLLLWMTKCYLYGKLPVPKGLEDKAGDRIHRHSWIP